MSKLHIPGTAQYIKDAETSDYLLILLVHIIVHFTKIGKSIGWLDCMWKKDVMAGGGEAMFEACSMTRQAGF